ncbi:MAG: AzlC family ABC transporter permease [Lachnospiraceae bacterium]|nr:AzlC family ABC transporter permease [Lachnospiraceae bacterium]
MKQTTYNPRAELARGMRLGIPIGLGYFAVSFSLGIHAKNAGLTAFQATLTSMLLNASAGEYVAFSLIAEQAAYIEIALMVLVANARYLLMSCSLSQKLSKRVTLPHRLVMSLGITDELFGVSMSRQTPVEPPFYYGMMLVALSLWAAGTGLGVIFGNLLPQNIVNALSVGLYGMFLAIIIPAAKQSRVIIGICTISMGASLAFSLLPYISKISVGTRTILLTVVISAFAAYFFPVPDKEEDDASKEPTKASEAEATQGGDGE